MVFKMLARRVMPGLVLIALAQSVLAHHGWSGNTAGNIEITGVIESGVSLSGPHGTMQIRDAKGQLWNITLAPGPRTHRSGLKESTIPVGATVTVQGQRNADSQQYEAKVRRVIWNDTEFDVYPSR
ncbi:MAG: hypothetical protein AB8B57_06355 [Congregibacter sp.]